MKVFLIAALSADGFIGRNADHLADWTSPEDKKHFVALTKQAGVMVMGARTFATIGRALPGRRTIVYTNNPERITTTGIETTGEPPTELIARLACEGAAGVAICGGASIYSLFMRAKVIDELYLTIEPTLFGHGVPLFASHLDTALTLIDHQQANSKGTLLLHYRIANP